jgi:hypothetical protein
MTVGCHVGGAGVGRRGQERVGWAHWLLASVGQPASAWHGIRHAQAGCLAAGAGNRRRGARIAAVATLAFSGGCRATV